jgi:putative oxidoreductase
MAVLFAGADDIGLLLLRAVLGIVFIAHGLPKFRGFAGTVKFVGSLGFRPAVAWAFLLAFAEFGGGIMLLAGLASRLAAALLIPSMLVALYHNVAVWRKPFKGGWELDLTLLAGLAAVLLLGAGAYSADAVLGWMPG